MAAASKAKWLVKYSPPFWCGEVVCGQAPKQRMLFANLPTPIHAVEPPSEFPIGVNLFIKRDDATGGCELGGNKLRKLEFLIADACLQGVDSVVTIGGIQSNHCRATVGAATMAGLKSHLVLRTNKPDEDPSFTGRLCLVSHAATPFTTVYREFNVFQVSWCNHSYRHTWGIW